MGAPDKDGVILKTKKLLTGLKPDRTGDINVKESYVADCKSCRKSLGDEGMSFVVGGATTWSEDDKLNRCLNYFVGHMRTECEAPMRLKSANARTGSPARKTLIRTV